MGVLERRVKVIGNLREAVGRLLLAVLVEDIELDSPLLHRESLDQSRLVTAVKGQFVPQGSSQLLSRSHLGRARRWNRRGTGKEFPNKRF
jgi:hypothetical protein